MDPGWEKTINNELRGTFKLMAVEMEQIATVLAPERTGRLKRSIRARVRQPAGTIYIELIATAPYAQFVEYGTGGRGRQTQNLAIGASQSQLRSFGRFGGYRHGPTKGMVAQPFLRPAAISIMTRYFRMGGS
jgi:hypothetical protein